MTPLPRMAGAHQVRNAALAIAMIRHQSTIDVPLAAIKAGIARASWPARLELLPRGALTHEREIWIDGAHNEAAARTLAVELAARPMHLVLGILANKDADGIIAALAPHVSSLTFVEVPGHASHDPAVLAARWGGRTAPSLPAALAGGPEPALIAGSLYLCGEALRLNGTPPT